MKAVEAHWASEPVCVITAASVCSVLSWAVGVPGPGLGERARLLWVAMQLLAYR